MRPERWFVDPQLQEQITAARPPAIQAAVDKVMEARGDLLLNIALGQQLSPSGPPVGGVLAALQSAIAQAIIFVISNEDPSYVNRMKLTAPQQPSLLVAQMDPREAARIARDALKQEDPRR